jgi:hypothetical protein
MKLSLRAFVALVVWAGVASAQGVNTTCAEVEGTIYDFTLKVPVTGEDLNLDDYRGKVMVIFNSATY